MANLACKPSCLLAHVFFSHKMNDEISASEENLDECHHAVLEAGSRRWPDVCPPFREVNESAQLGQLVPKS